MSKAAITESRKAKVTDEHKEEARKLRLLWDTRAHETQVLFGERYSIGNQSVVSQFLRGETPLSLEAARGFAQGLKCQISEFSPRLAKKAAELGMVAGTPTAVDLTKLDRNELQLVQLFRGLTPDQKHQLQIEANNLYTESHPGASSANPFGGKLPPSEK